MECYIIKGGKASLKYIKRRVVLWFCNFISVNPTYRPIQDLKSRLLRFIGVETGGGVEFSEKLFILNQGNLKIGSGSRIGTHCKIYNFSPINIGAKLLASHGLTIISGTHDVNSYESLPGPVEVGDNVWIGINVTIIGPVKIGNNVIIGAGAVVLRDIPDNVIAAGVPAKVIRLKKEQ